VSSKILRACLVCVACLPAAGLGQIGAPPYPAKAVRVIVGFPPGAGVDIVTRIVTPRLGEALGQQFVVDNRPGAGGIVAAEVAARAPADGYTLFAGSSSLTTAPLTTRVPYSIRDFTPIARTASVPFILVVHPTMPVRSLGDLIALARAKPGVINFASTGNWTGPHLTTELFKRAAGIDITHVPYKGSAPAITDLLGGHVDMFFCNMLSATPHIASGRLRALAVSSARRSPVTPNVPAVAESGFPGFETGTWFGILAPAGTSKDIVGRLHGEISKVVRRADVQEQLASQGATAIVDKGPDDFAVFLGGEVEKFGKVIKSLGAGVQ